MRIFKHSLTHMHMHHRRARSGWQAQQCPLQAAISMEIVLIVPADHTGSARRAGCESVRAETLYTSCCLGHDPISPITNQSLNDYGIHAVDCFNANAETLKG